MGAKSVNTKNQDNIEMIFKTMKKIYLLCVRRVPHSV